ncbi:MAG: hypothetical protein IT349_15010 [Candidatus Eisenbacteria bacterium]|nr:hypothetical protein [Candidatus Eisenbacteria bacterium]
MTRRPRSIRSRLHLTLCVAFLVVFSALCLQFVSERNGLDSLLDQRTAAAARRLDQSVELASRPLQTFAADYTYWTEFVEFVDAPSPDWAQINLLPPIETYHADAIWVHRTDGTVVFAHDVTGPSHAPSAVVSPGEIAESLNGDRTPHYFLRTGRGPMLIAAATIHQDGDPDHRTEPHGYFVVGRYLTAAALREVGQLSDAQVTVTDSAGAGSPRFGEITVSIPLPGRNGAPVAWLSARTAAPELVAARDASDRALLLHVALIGGVLLVLAAVIRVWITEPLGALARGLRTADSAGLEDLEQQEHEFGDLARIIRGYAERRELERELEARRRIELELRQEKALADRSSESKSHFLASMSHEIRTPMNGILALLELVRDTAKLEPEHREHLQVAHRSAERLLELINDILDLSKIESGRVEASIESFDLRLLIEEVAAPVRVQLESRDIQLHIRIDEALPSALVSEPTWLRQILTNLVGNAAKFTARGEISIAAIRATMETKRGVLDAVVLRVRDTGVGIPTGRLESVFEPFTQADRTTAQRYGGTGLGLAICRELVQRLDGAIRVESTVDEGSCFEVVLPLRPHDSDRAAA